MNKAKILALAKRSGYKGADDDVVALKKFLTEQGIEPVDADLNPIDIDKVFAAKKVVVSDDNQDDGDDDAESVKDLKAKLERAEEKARLAAGRNRVRDPRSGEDEDEGTKRWSPAAWARAAVHKAYNRKANRGETAYDDADIAEYVGCYQRMKIHALLGSEDYPQKAWDKDVVTKATQIEGDNVLGGALVPNDFVSAFIDLKAEYGICRQVGRVERMARDTATFPRRTSGTTVYFPGETGAVTQSTMGLNNVTVTAKKFAQLTTISSELLNDSAVNIADTVTREHAYQFAKKEDECYFIGDGTATYGSIQGWTPTIKGLSGTIGNIAGLYVGAGDLFSELTLSDWENTASLLPNYVRSPVWVMHQRAYWQAAARLLYQPGSSGGGATAAEISTGVGTGLGVTRPMFLGYPVIFSEAMLRTDATVSSVIALFGDFKLGAIIGDVDNGASVLTSAERYFDQDMIAIRSIQRVGIVVHDAGNASATEASRVPGPVVGLITKAS